MVVTSRRREEEEEVVVVDEAEGARAVRHQGTNPSTSASDGEGSNKPDQLEYITSSLETLLASVALSSGMP